MTTVVQLSQVQKYYGNLCALGEVSLELQAGEILGLLGHNGAGKTTTMKLVLGVIAATRGEVRLFGESPLGPHADRLRRRIGYLPENVSFYSQLSGGEVVEYFARLKGVAVAEQRMILEKVGLAHAAGRRVKTYSKGMRQRLGLAQALLGQPRLLVLDEPTAGLDPIATSEFYAMLDELRKQGTTVLISSHVLPGIEKHIDRAAILGEGKLLALGSLAELSQAAKLPLIIHVRGSWENTDWCKKLDHYPASFQKINGTRVTIRTAMANKIEIMRLLLSEPQIEDIDIRHPTLDDLYAHYSSPLEQGDGP